MLLKKYAASFITAGKESGGSQSDGHDLSRAHRASPWELKNHRINSNML
jgi:hypothetical protein